MNPKQIFDSIDESKRQELAESLVKREVYLCQSSLIDKLIENQTDGFSYDDIENLYSIDREDEENPEDMACQEVFEWWAVSDWFADKLRAADQPIIANDYGTWWGRTCTGQSISCDYNIQMIACEMYNIKMIAREIECEIKKKVQS